MPIALHRRPRPRAAGGERPRARIQDRASRAKARLHSVLFRLLVSYVALILLVALSVTGVSYLYFQGRYNAELENFHSLYLKNIEKELQRRLADSALGVYLEIESLLSSGEGPLFGPEDGLDRRSGRVYSTYLFLGNLAARNYGVIEAIHLYYVKSGIVVSSTGSSVEGGNAITGLGRSWHGSLAGRGTASAWEPWERPAYYGIPALQLYRNLRCYPILASPQDSTVVVAIDFRADLVREIMDRLLPEESGATALMSLDSPSSIEGRGSAAWEGPAQAAARGLIAEGRQGVASRRLDTGSGSALLTVLPFADTGWYLANLAPYSKLYQRGADIRLVLALICLAAVALGLALSAFLSSRLYNPLGRLLKRFRALFGLPEAEPAEPRDEYEVLGSALDGISTRMGELEAAIEAHRPAIKNELTARLLEGEPVEAEELQDSLALLGLPPLPGRLGTALLLLPVDRSADAGQGAGSGGLLKHRLAAEIESSFPGAVLTAALPGRQVGLVLAATEEEGYAGSLASLAELARSMGGPGAVLAAGPRVGSPAELAASFASARDLAEYHFLFPELAVIDEKPGSRARAERVPAADPAFLQALASSLANRDLPAFSAQLRRYRQSARSGDRDPRSCRAELEQVNLRIVAAARELALETDPSFEADLRGLLAEAETLDSYLEELATVAGDLCASDRSPREQRNSLLVSRIKAYVKDRLAEELSLDRVSEAMALSPGYLCTVFKEASGASFLSYVKELRLEEAARLLEEGRESVQEVGRRVGFGASAYFIRVFKSRYGQTPLEYRRSRSGEMNSA